MIHTAHLLGLLQTSHNELKAGFSCKYQERWPRFAGGVSAPTICMLYHGDVFSLIIFAILDFVACFGWSALKPIGFQGDLREVHTSLQNLNEVHNCSTASSKLYKLHSKCLYRQRLNSLCSSSIPEYHNSLHYTLNWLIWRCDFIHRLFPDQCLNFQSALPYFQKIFDYHQRIGVV